MSLYYFELQQFCHKILILILYLNCIWQFQSYLSINQYLYDNYSVKYCSQVFRVWEVTCIARINFIFHVSEFPRLLLNNHVLFSEYSFIVTTNILLQDSDKNSHDPSTYLIVYLNSVSYASNQTFKVKYVKFSIEYQVIRLIFFYKLQFKHRTNKIFLKYKNSLP